MFTQRICLGYLRQLASRNRGRLGHTTSQTTPQYDVSEKMRKLFEIKQKQREATKAYFQKLVMNPYRPKSDTVPFDPVLFRYNAFMTYHHEYFKPNLKNTAFVVSFYILPMILVGWILSLWKNDRENKLKSGQIAYKDRFDKGIL